MEGPGAIPSWRRNLFLNGHAGHLGKWKDDGSAQANLKGECIWSNRQIRCVKLTVKNEERSFFMTQTPRCRWMTRSDADLTRLRKRPWGKLPVRAKMDICYAYHFSPAEIESSTASLPLVWSRRVVLVTVP